MSAKEQQERGSSGKIFHEEEKKLKINRLLLCEGLATCGGVERERETLGLGGG